MLAYSSLCPLWLLLSTENTIQCCQSGLNMRSRGVVMRDHANRGAEAGREYALFAQLGADVIIRQAGIRNVKDDDVGNYPFWINLHSRKSGKTFRQSLRVGMIFCQSLW